VDTSSYVPVRQFAMWGFLSIKQLCDDCVGGEVEEKHGLEPLPSFINCMLLMNLLNNSFTHTALASMVNRTF
jgi:hypothetical protein